MLAERFRHLHFGSLQNTEKFQGVHDGLAQVVIVGDHVGVTGVFADGTNTSDPGIEFLGGVEVVVAFVWRRCRIVVEPGVVTATVKANVADFRRGFRGRGEGVADDRLIDVAETDSMIAQESESVWSLPGRMAQLNDKGIIREAGEDTREVVDGFGGAMKGKRELKEDRAEFVCLSKNIETCTNGALVFGGGRRVVSEFLPEFRGEHKGRISGDAVEPECGVIGTQRLVERGIDFDSIEEFG